jgi:hypothetical protein
MKAYVFGNEDGELEDHSDQVRTYHPGLRGADCFTIDLAKD